MRLLLLGGSGLVGRAIARSPGAHRCVSTHDRHPVTGSIAFNAVKNDLRHLLTQQGDFDAALVLFGITKPDVCFADPNRAAAVNVDGVKRVIEVCAERGIRVVYFSTELVFDGLLGPYDENSVPNPRTVYGRHKAELEAYCLSHHPSSLVVRLARVVGLRLGDGTFLTQLAEDLLAGRPVVCAEDSVFSPVLAEDIAEAVLRLMQTGANGRVNVAGAQFETRCAMVAKMIAGLQAAGLQIRSKLCKKRLSDLNTIEPRPPNVALSIDRLRALTGFTPRGVDEIVAAIVTRVVGSQTYPKKELPCWPRIQN